MVVNFYPSQIGSILVTPLSYTASPFKLILDDLLLVFSNLAWLPWVFLPLTPAPSGDLCELSPTVRNLIDLSLQAFLFFFQLCLLLSIPLWILMPVWMLAIIFIILWVFHYLISFILNGPRSVRTYESAPEYAQRRREHAHERWLYLNGVCTGRHWLESGVNRLALTFGRPVMGIHNRTNGLILDLIECLIQRDLNYATTDIRTAYPILKRELYDPDVKRVILVCYSQGGIEGSMIIDWLLDEIPQDLLQKLEVYTFGNAANHFNNPHLHLASQKSALAHPSLPATVLTKTVTSLYVGSGDPIELPANRNANGKSITHMEHFAHTDDFVSRIGILHYYKYSKYGSFAPRFMGRMFEVKASGHMFVQHYLDTMFPLSKGLRKRLIGTGKGPDSDGSQERVEENAKFMESVVEGKGRVAPNDKFGREDWEVSLIGESGAEDGIAPQRIGKKNGAGAKKTRGTTLTDGLSDGELGARDFKVMNLSRLWLYRNGKSPMD